MTPEDKQHSDLEEEIAALTPVQPSSSLTDRIVAALAEDDAIDERALHDIESDLAALTPATPSAALTEAIVHALADEREQFGENGENTKEAQIVDFSDRDHQSARPDASRDWRPFRQVLAVAALLALSVFLISHLSDELGSPETHSITGNGFPPVGSASLAQPAPAGNLLPAGFANNVVGSRSEGIVRGVDNRLYRKVVREFVDTFDWRDPQTGKTLRIEQPRRQIVLIPIDPF